MRLLRVLPTVQTASFRSAVRSTDAWLRRGASLRAGLLAGLLSLHIHQRGNQTLLCVELPHRLTRPRAFEGRVRHGSLRWAVVASGLNRQPAYFCNRCEPHDLRDISCLGSQALPGDFIQSAQQLYVCTRHLKVFAALVHDFSKRLTLKGSQLELVQCPDTQAL